MQQLIASDTQPDLVAMLDLYDCPAILVNPDYRILAANQAYRLAFGDIPRAAPAHCYEVSHGYTVPCDQAGELCPLRAALTSRARERVLHIHQSPRGPEHVDVELLPLLDAHGEIKYFVELLKPIRHASPQVDRSELVGNSPAFNHMIEQLTRVAPSDASVLLLGESGTGKELAAGAIHRISGRKGKPQVTLECAGLSETLFESELFGHVKGAFTGAHNNKEGLAAAANGGTLFLDEIGDVPLALQVKLLRLLETGTYRQVGSSELRHTDFRLVCATHKDIPAMVERDEFRQDLWFRINVFPVRVPALRERQSDIGLLASTILKRLDASHAYTLTDSAVMRLKQHEFKGNVRELRNILARALVFANTNVIDQHVIARCIDLDTQFAPGPDATSRSEAQPGSKAELPDLVQNEKDYLVALMQHCRGNKEQAAQQAGISLRSLYRKLAGHGLGKL